MRVVIVDYGMGNIYSIQSALRYLGYDSEYTSQHERIQNADKLILPGVGSYRKAMHNIKAEGLDDIIKESVLNNGVQILGICLGMQLLGVSSTEESFTLGLGLFDGVVERFCNEAEIKVPHIGYSEVHVPSNTRLLNNLNPISSFYFVHSYRMVCDKIEKIAVCTYGEKFVAAFEKENVFGTQFHPEKSQSNGLIVLNNYLRI